MRPPQRRLTAGVVATFSATAAAGSSLTISASLRAETVIAPLPHHAGRHRDARADLEIRGGQPHAAPSASSKHIGEDRQRLPGLDDVVNHLEAFEERVAIQHDFHEGSPLLF